MGPLPRWSRVGIGILIGIAVAFPIGAESRRQIKQAMKLLAKIKLVDGAGSGLDADTVQGMTAAQLQASVTPGPPGPRGAQGPSGPPGPTGPPGSADVGHLTALLAAFSRSLALFYAPVRQPEGPGIGLFVRGSDGNTPPAVFYSGESIQGSINGVAVAPSGRVFALFNSFGNDIVAIFDPVPASDGAPAQLISGPNTRLGNSLGIALDPEGNVHVPFSGNCFLAGADGGVVSFAPGANGDATPRSVLTGPRTQLDCPEGVAFDDAGQLYVADTAAAAVFVFAPGASGDVAPTAVIRRISSPQGIAIGADGSIYVSAHAINVYPPGSNGDNVVPVRVIAGDQTRLSQPTGIAVDADGRIFTSDTEANMVLIFAADATGNAAPIAIIQGSETLLDFPFGVAIPR